ncbi:D-alanyl-D-alanine carboxypeptidase family protein [Acetobacter sp. DmW_043]|uniref:D-alanyl-D-alanine carboxypeptidase family protein n=1 Tax=Acetobacter sp. DmW_043 TaxID=1670658 RepID=UPI000A372089
MKNSALSFLFPLKKTNKRKTRLSALTCLLTCTALGTLIPKEEAFAQYTHQVSTIVVDARTGAVLSQTDPDLRRYPASLTKLMTLYMAFSALRAGTVSLSQQLPVSIHAVTMEPSKLGVAPGTMLTVEQAILALVTKSANDAACALGEFLGGGSEPQFAAMMTQQAHILGMQNTTFRNASGLPDPDQVTTARDLSYLASHLIADFPEYYHYFSTESFYFHHRVIPNHNPMLRSYAGADGMKTGYTQEAGHNLVTSAMRSNVRLIGVVLGAPSNNSRNIVMASQLDRGFDAEGVAPVERPLLLARHTVPTRQHKHQLLMLASAHHRGRGSQVVEVAEAPLSSHRRAHAKPVTAGHHHVQLVGAKLRQATTGTHTTLHHSGSARHRT